MPCPSTPLQCGLRMGKVALTLGISPLLVLIFGILTYISIDLFFFKSSGPISRNLFKTWLFGLSLSNATCVSSIGAIWLVSQAPARVRGRAHLKPRSRKRSRNWNKHPTALCVTATVTVSSGIMSKQRKCSQSQHAWEWLERKLLIILIVNTCV